MKEIFRIYGGVIIACMVALMLLGIISGMIFGGTLVAKNMRIPLSGGNFDRTLTVSFNDYKSKRAPKVCFDGKQEIHTGESVRVSNLFYTEDDSPGAFKVIGIYDTDGSVISQEERSCEDTLEFNEPGVYKVCCKAEAVRGISRITYHIVTVNRRAAS